MFSFLLVFASSVWETKYLGEPVLSRIRESDLMISTKDGYVAMLNESSGELYWRQYIPNALAIDLIQFIGIVGTKHYYYILDRETGLILHQYRHSIKNMKEIDCLNDTIVIRNETHLASYELENLTWIIRFDDIEPGLNITDDGSVICGHSLINGTNGERIGDSKYEYSPVDIRYVPTLITCYKDGVEIWNISEPLHQAKLLLALTRSLIVLNNDTHLLVFDLVNEELALSREAKIITYTSDSNGLIYETPEGIYHLQPKGLKITKYTKKIIQASLNNKTITIKGREFVLPQYCKVICHSFNSFGGIITAKCNKTIQVAVFDSNGKVKSLNHASKSKFGTCWTQDEYAAVSFMRKSDKVNYVNSFGLTNSSQRSFVTQHFITAAGWNHYVSSNGNKQTIKPSQFSAFQSLNSADSNPYNPNVFGEEVDGAYNGVTAIADHYGCLVFQVMNRNLVAVEGSVSDENTLHLCIMAIPSAIALFLLYNSFSSKKDAFWR